MRDNSAHMMRTVHLHGHEVLTAPSTVQLQAWRLHCPISVQIGLVIANHVREYCYSFDC